MGVVISAKLATLHELDTVYGVRDLWKLMDVVLVDRHNDRLIELAKITEDESGP